MISIIALLNQENLSLLRERILGSCMCFDDVYVKILYHFIIEQQQFYFLGEKACFEFMVLLILLKISFFIHLICDMMYGCVHVTVAI